MSASARHAAVDVVHTGRSQCGWSARSAASARAPRRSRGRAARPAWRARGRRRSGSRRRHGRTRTAGCPRTRRGPPGCSSRGPAARGRTGAGTTRPASVGLRHAVHAGPPKTARQSFGGCAPSSPRPGRKRTAPARASRGRRRAPRRTTGARRRSGSGRCRAAPAGRAVGLLDQRDRLVERAEGRVDVAVVGDVVAAVRLRRGVPGVDPDRVHAEPREVGEAARGPREVAEPVAVPVREAADVQLIRHRAPPPRGAAGARRGLFSCLHAPHDLLGHAARPYRRAPRSLPGTAPSPSGEPCKSRSSAARRPGERVSLSVDVRLLLRYPDGIVGDVRSDAEAGRQG